MELMLFEGKEVEVLELDGNVLFNPRDVAECLEIVYKTAQNHMLEMSDKQVVKLKNSNACLKGFRKLHNTGENFLTESGVYKLIFKSRKKEAEKFQDWVTDDVLPTIRKHQAYIQPNKLEELVNNPDLLIELATKLKQEQEARKAAESKNAILMHVTKSYTVTEVAKEANLKSAIALNKILVDMKVQFKSNGTYVPYSKYADKGYFDIKQDVLENGKVIYHRKVTQIGREFILELLENS